MNKMFSLNLSGNVSRALTVKGDDDAKLWHLRNVVFDEDAEWKWEQEPRNDCSAQRSITFDSSTDEQGVIEVPSSPSTPSSHHSSPGSLKSHKHLFQFTHSFLSICLEPLLPDCLVVFTVLLPTDYFSGKPSAANAGGPSMTIVARKFHLQD
ncbi:hypothetical protein MRB53_023177 [Persea americana]|uniref:Uncharacterized protein n=1 Tax=Persea americana TaxID=3435 RepID=A0ACC2L8S3_PERAE|nr:hypothetical protein MRB53_023177 [Persea americana]